MKKGLLFVFYLQLIFSHLYSQNQQANLEKYWSYRARFLNEFIQVGDQQGMSMPATRKDTIQQLQVWGDNTIMLGWYMSMLATEHYLLSNQQKFSGYDNNDTAALTATENELYYALKGLRRLDETAEISFPSPCDSLGLIRNGFFIRDDVPADFHTHFANISTVKSDFTSTNVYDNEMSQDQVYHLLTGLAMIKKFVPSTLVVNGMNIRQEAVEQALLMVEWMSRDAWVIKNPACLVSGVPKNVARGENAFLFSHGLNEMVKYMSDGTVNYDVDVQSTATTVWNSLNVPTNPGYNNIDNLHMAMTIAAVGQGWGNGTLAALIDLSTINKWSAYPMMYCLLYDDTASAGFPVFRDTLNIWTEAMLHEAPVQGPYSDYPDSVAHGYAVWNRFTRARATHYIGISGNMKNKFSGIDYMTLHNLYYALSPSKWISTVGIKNIGSNDAMNMKLYPNPAKDFFIVEAKNNSAGNIEVTMYNAIGQQVYQSAMMHTQKIDVRDFPQGYYQLIFRDEDGGRMRRGVIVGR